MVDRSIPEGFHTHKYNALGNDYLVIDPAEFDVSLNEEAIRALCDRNRGVGSDGILYGPLASFEGGIWRVDGETLAEADNESRVARTSPPFFLRIFNPDGSEAEKSGNGLRIFSLYLHESGRVGFAPFEVQTKGGKVACTVLPGEGPERRITVAMGAPEILSNRLTFLIDGIEFRAVSVSMGNPHCVLLGSRPSPELARRIGPIIEHHPDFPNRTNVQFLEVLDRENIRIEIWERGAGYTLASGSSSCAAAAAAKHLGLVDDQVAVHMPGGVLEIDMREENIRMTGPAVRTFDALLAPALYSAAYARH
ncbi:Diaminopimelate epimerase 1 [uncultured spirochete]|jgi:diaminopimelate epimerase|uniref:Diaminopimelate epimerase n=1 Tax=uncultured spirochete TaxID=156406 RepID=A0A3P3XM76_9SPIR|nr:diaminopimelate epimerase [Rectinema subterraneum]SLM15228.1 Diaminopimelate epimerase 1 [uncultured spirochete]